MKRRLYQGTDFRRAQNIDELRAVARRRVPNSCFEYVEDGSDDEVTLRRNRSVFEEIGFVPRTLVDVSARGQAIDLLGKPSAAPFMIGPTGFSGLLGCADLSQLDASFLRWPGRPVPPARDAGSRRGILPPVAGLATNSNQRREAQI